MEVLNFFTDNIVRLIFLTTLLCHKFAKGLETFTISRAPGTGNPWTEFDRFKLPDSKCSTIYCTQYKAYTVTPARECWCECSYNQKTTFGYYSGHWTCLDNTKVRNQAGCKYKFKSVPDSTYPLKIVKHGIEYNTILPSANCSVDQMTSRYFTCDGRWTGIDSQSFSQWFSILENRERRSDSQTFKVDIGSNINADLLGRIISLGITCPGENSCLLFKLKGTFQCAENVTSIITSPRSAIPTTKASITTVATSTINATANQINEEGKAKTSRVSSTVVGVVVTLVIIVAIVILIVAYVYRKRKRGESVLLLDYISSRVTKLRSTQPAKKKTEDEAQEDPEYAEIPEEQRRNEPVDQAGGIYSYAFDDPQTAYIAPEPAPYNRLVHNQHTPDQEGAIYSTADDGPMYNVLERPLAENHIMMIPESNMNEGPPSQDFEQGYHVLEGPHTTEDTTDSPFNGTTDVRASIGPANPIGPQTGHAAVKERRKPPSPPRKVI